MKREEILKTIFMLAKVQGFYSRLYCSIMESNEEDRECFLSKLEEQNFKDTLDLIYYFEGWGE